MDTDIGYPQSSFNFTLLKIHEMTADDIGNNIC